MLASFTSTDPESEFATEGNPPHDSEWSKNALGSLKAGSATSGQHRQKGSFREPGARPLMTGDGWVAALSETIAECAFNPLRERVVNDVHDRAASIHQYRQISPVSKPNTLAP